MPSNHNRNEKFADKIQTSIWYEFPAKDNPYLTDQCYCHGEAIIDLMSSQSFDEYLFFLLTAKLPSHNQKKLFNLLLIAASNLGPRHPASRAVIIAGASKTHSQNLLPLGLSILGGSYLGASEVVQSMKWIEKNKNSSIKKIIEEINSTLPNKLPQDEKLQEHIIPGFGRHFGGIEPWPKRLVKKFVSCSVETTHLQFGENLVLNLEKQFNVGWLITGVIAAVLLDLGFNWKAGGMLLQLLAMPGLTAHAMEMSEKDYTDLPFISEENYILSPKNK